MQFLARASSIFVVSSCLLSSALSSFSLLPLSALGSLARAHGSRQTSRASLSLLVLLLVFSRVMKVVTEVVEDLHNHDEHLLISLAVLSALHTKSS